MHEASKPRLAVDAGEAETARAIGELVRDKRKELGLDQAQLAAAANVAVRTVSQIESGKATIRLDVMVRTLRALGLELELAPRTTSWLPGVDRDNA